MLILIIRTLLLYLLVMIALRLMGKQQIGQLQPFEFVAALMIAEVATIPMENINAPLVTGIIPVVTILMVQVVFGFSALKSNRFRRWLSGTPTIIIRDGQIVEQALAQSRYNINDLLEQLRLKDCHNLADVAFAVLETNGELSIIPKSVKEAATMEAVGLTPPPAVYPAILILDGQTQEHNLTLAGYSSKKLSQDLAAQGIHSPSQVLLAILDTGGQLFVQRKETL